VDERLAQELTGKIETIMRLLAHQVSQAHETLETKAAVLSTCGLTPKDIATICGSTSGAVRVALTHARKKTRKRKGK
jgi:DNA-directed RNA polymerase specialized sigma24 family protein